MKHYIVTGRVFEIPANSRVELTREQYSVRRHALKQVAEGVYETLQSIQFKNGEKVTTDLEVGKAQMIEVVPVQEDSDPALAQEAAKKAGAIAGKKKGA